MQHKLSSYFQMTKVGRDYNIVLQCNTSKACSKRKKWGHGRGDCRKQSIEHCTTQLSVHSGRSWAPDSFEGDKKCQFMRWQEVTVSLFISLSTPAFTNNRSSEVQRFNNLAAYVSYTAMFKNYSFGGEGLSWNQKFMAPLTATLKFMPEEGKSLPARLKTRDRRSVNPFLHWTWNVCLDVLKSDFKKSAHLQDRLG